MRVTRVVRLPFIGLFLASAVLLPVIFSQYYPVGGSVVMVAHPAFPPYNFPDGGRTLFPRYRFVALYGTPGTPLLGVLGAQDVQATVERVKALAAQYQPLVAEHILPTMEIITTVASASPTEDGDYSYPIAQDTLQTWITAAQKAGVYVVLDLQPGRSSFLRQAEQFAPLLAEPNVGLALDPEWRLKPDQKPLVQIGSVEITEVNQTVAWLADLTKDDKLPQKLLVLHEFRTDMLPNRDQLDTTRSELAYVIQMDGQGSQEGKLNTWQAITAVPPANMHFGWKNFYAKDATLRSPEDTMKLSPEPWYVSYQ